MVEALFDTNILIDYLNRVPQARTELARYERRAISIVTWIEVMVGAPSEQESATRAVLGRFSVIALDDRVAERTFRLRQQTRIKLPDAIVWASAQVHSFLLVTRDGKDFPQNDPGIRVPYKI